MKLWMHVDEYKRMVSLTDGNNAFLQSIESTQLKTVQQLEINDDISRNYLVSRQRQMAELRNIVDKPRDHKHGLEADLLIVNEGKEELYESALSLQKEMFDLIEQVRSLEAKVAGQCQMIDIQRETTAKLLFANRNLHSKKQQPTEDLQALQIQNVQSTTTICIFQAYRESESSPDHGRTIEYTYR